MTTTKPVPYRAIGDTMPDSPIEDHVLSIEIKTSVQNVWNEITKTGKIQRALYNTVLETDLTPGSRLRYYSPDKKRVFIVGEVVEVDPPTKFSHTYKFTQQDEPPTLVTCVVVCGIGGVGRNGDAARRHDGKIGDDPMR